MYYLAYHEDYDEEKGQSCYHPLNVGCGILMLCFFIQHTQVTREVLCQINCPHNHNERRLGIFNEILHYSSGVSHTILGHTSRIGITTSHTNTLKTLKELSKDGAKKLEVIARNPSDSLDLIFDNSQMYKKQWET